MSQANFVNGAAGSVNPSVFVVFDTTSNKSVNQATGSSAFLIGVSQEYAKYAPLPGASVVAADTVNDPLLIYQEGDECLLTATSAGWTAGDRLTANASGQGITASGTNYYGALALSTATGTGLYQVKIVTGKNP